MAAGPTSAIRNPVNNDVRITDGFHEFSFDLETDRAGDFYFREAMPVNQGGRGFMP